MAGAAIIAAALAGGTSPFRMLWVGGLDVWNQPGATKGQAYGVDVDSVTVREAAAGQVSDMTFAIDDPAKTCILPADGDLVRFHDASYDRPHFLGVVARFAVETAGLGRRITVWADGIESILDRSIVVSLTIASGTALHTAYQSVLANAVGIGWPWNGLGTSTVWPEPDGILTSGNAIGSDVDVSGLTIRQAFAALEASRSDAQTWPVTVSMYGRIVYPPLGGANLDASDAGGPYASDPVWVRDFTESATDVYIRGGNAAGTGLVSRGPVGGLGRVVVVSEPRSTSTNYLGWYGRVALAEAVVEDGGSYRIDDQWGLWDSVAGKERRARLAKGGLVDAALGASFTNTNVDGITKRYSPTGTESWTVEHSGSATSVLQRLRKTQSRIMRRWTRNLA